MFQRLIYLAKVAVAFALAIGLGFVLFEAATSTIGLGWWAVVLWIACMFAWAAWLDRRHGYPFNKGGGGDTERPQ